MADVQIRSDSLLFSYFLLNLMHRIDSLELRDVDSSDKHDLAKFCQQFRPQKQVELHYCIEGKGNSRYQPW